MSKTAKIREALKAAGAKRLTLSEIAARSGIKNPGPYMAGMRATGEISIEGEIGSMTYAINPDFVPTRGGKSPRKRAEKKPEPTKKTTRKKTARKPKRVARKPGKGIRRIAEITAGLEKSTTRPLLSQLLTRNLIANGRSLHKVLRDQVTGLDKNPSLVAALELHERSAALIEEAGVA